MQIVKIIFILFFVSSLFAGQINYYTKGDTKIYLIKIDKIKRNVKNNKLIFYEKDNGEQIALRDTFFVKINTNSSIQDILKKYNLTLIKKYSEYNYLLKSDSSDILNIINQLHLDKNTIYAYPNFYSKVQQR